MMSTQTRSAVPGGQMSEGGLWQKINQRSASAQPCGHESALRRPLLAALLGSLMTLFLASNCLAGIQMVLDTKDNGGNDVGRVIVLNADDDNRDGIPDMNESPVVGETSLRKLTVSWVAPELFVYLKKGANGDKVRVWRDSEKRQEVLFDDTSNKFLDADRKVVLFVEGVKPSDKTDDVELFANFDNKDDKQASVKLTVLWVDTWDFKVSNADSWNADFKPTNDPRTHEVDPKDGHTGLHVYTDRLGQGIQLHGRVMPSDFAPAVTMVVERAKMICEFRDMNEGDTFVRKENFSTNNPLTRVRPAPGEQDTCDQCNQTDPQKSDPKGFIYDWDDSGILNSFPKGTVDRTRKNFLQWPRFGSKRAGVFAYWSQAISAKPTADPPQEKLADIPFENSFNARGDNKDLGNGLTLASFKTNLSFDLNSASCTDALSISNASLPNGKVGTAYAQTTVSRGGFPPVTWTISKGSLPDGLTLTAANDMASANIQGTPTKAGTFTFSVKATDSASPTKGTAEKDFTIVIAAGGDQNQSSMSAPPPSSEPSESDSGPTLAGSLQAIGDRSQSEDGEVRTQALLELGALVSLKTEAPLEFAALEDSLISSVRTLAPSAAQNDREKAFHQITMLGDLQSEKSLPVLVDNLTFHNPYVTIYDRGPLSYTEPEPGDLPVFQALTQIGDKSIDLVARRAIAEDDQLVQSSLAQLLIYFYDVQGALDWLDRAASQEGLSVAELNRIQAIRQMVVALQ